MFGQSLLSAFGSTACTTDTDQLFTTNVQTTSLATYQLNNATTSIPSNTYPGTANNITYAAGKFGNAAVFNGSSSIITVANSSGNNMSTFSISLWFNTSGHSAAATLINNGGADSTQVGWFLGLNASGNLFFTTSQGGVNQTSATGTTNYEDSSWHNVVLAYTAVGAGTSTYNVYVDGNFTPEITGTNGQFTSTATQPLTIGRFARVAIEFFNGSIDQVRIFNSALPQTAVTALYNETTTTATYPYVDYVNANPNSIAYYKMSDATDQLGNYNGTASNVNFNTEGKFGFAGAFNGSNSKIDISSPIGNALSNANDNFSVSLWVNWNSITGTAGGFNGAIIGNSTGSSYGSFALYSYGNAAGISVAFERYFNNTGYYNSSYLTAAPFAGVVGTWYNLVFTYVGSSKTVTTYIDGTALPTYTLNVATGSRTMNSSNSFGSYNGSSSGLDGKLDQIRIYNSALSAANVTALYNEIECPTVAVTNAFNAVLYTGDGSSSKSITGTGFAPDFTWIKDRDDTENHALFDTVRGANEWLHSNNTDAQTTYSGNYGLLSWQSDGFTVGNGTAVNKNNDKYVSWNWKAGGAATTIAAGTVSNDIASDVSANTATGFSIVKYTGTLNSAGNIDVAHGLGAAPELIISKRTDSTGSWRVRPFFLNSDPYNYLELDTSGAISSFGTVDGTMAMPTSNVFSNNWNSGLGGIGDVIAYCWRSIPGYSKVGTYIGNGSTTGPEIYTGFKPAWLMTKPTTSGYWYILDNKRNTSNPRNTGLFPNDSLAEITNANYNVDFNNTGFQPKNNTTGFNELGITYIYMTFSE